ncbi:hypothetical protein M378DRAFT_186940 [Amanita muscaria Koide BX008]|uniref:Cytochrome P450 n=1 Tax=Amanita muscaria (strain Koide BX008) TaxID=946122 RepID=A0A0C2X4S3_AMAMK|nr:hypothetical protein M378DRAFT_186940 [Amanita muscaria Koide BX008]
MALYITRNRHALPLPPGPKGYPLIGNALDMPTNAMHEKYREWCKMLSSDIIFLNVAGRGVIVLDSSEAAIELLERRSSIYSGRPAMPMIHDVVQCDFNFGFLPYADRRAHRKLMHQVFNPTNAEVLHPHLLKCTHKFLRRFLEKPGEVMGHLRHLAGETIISYTYGLDTQGENDPYLKLSEEGVRAFSSAAVPGAFLVDSIPILRHVPEWFPGAGFKKKAKEWRVVLQTMVEKPFRAAMDRIESGTFSSSFVSECYSQIDEKDSAGQEYIIKSTAATLYGAGSSTTAVAIANCILALLKYPDILRRAQEQIDSVVPFGDLPTFKHQDQLPLITAICMESMRWRDVTPLAVPHLLTQDDVYKGYRLPKGSIVVANSWAMLHDETLYHDPFEFKPDRFLKDGQINKAVRDPAFATFGFGRRICPGRFMALSSIWIAVASLIATCDIANLVDANGNVIETKPEYESTTLAKKPKAFTCSIKPRTKKHEKAIFATASQ